jgi:hypothetical protein
MSPQPRLVRISLGIFFACTILTAGCGQGGQALVPVTGKVTVAGQPLSGGHVSLFPYTGQPVQGPTEGAGGLSTGTIDSSGTYSISTDGRSGAPVGKYKVTVNPTMIPTGDGKMPQAPFNSKFSDAKKTTLIIEVVGNAAPGAYDLKLTK